MNLVTLFILRLRRNSIFLALVMVVLSIPVALTFRNVLEVDRLRFEDRVRINRIKRDAEYILYADNAEESLDSDATEYYKKILILATDYLDNEYRQGKSQTVLKTELELYRTLHNWEAKGHLINHYTSSELSEKIAVYSEVLEQSLDFHYPSAPNDFYLILLQILPVSNMLLPALICCITVWLLINDLSKHRGLLFSYGLSPSQYANSLTLLAVFMYTIIYALGISILLVLSSMFLFTFQIRYPVLIQTTTISTVATIDIIKSLLFEMVGLACLSLIFIRLFALKILEKYKKR
ncbi:hypothetical protein K6V43_06775 [Streptococcus suis]|nr:hypothetical protein [Streptococcus suis]